MWRKLLVSLLLGGGTLAYAAQEPRAVERPSVQVYRRDPAAASAQVRAATDRAIAGLYDQIAQMPLSPEYTVGRWVKELHVREEFDQHLHRAEQLGEPRWIDEHTCQVRLEISKDKVAYALRQLAGAWRNASPLTVAEIDRAVAAWPRRAFAATGSSASPRALVDIRPVVGGQWTTVTEQSRQDALRAANDDAINRTLESIGSVRLEGQKTLADALSNPEVSRPVRQWLSSQPVTRVVFRDDLEVEVTLGVDEHEFFNQVRSALDNQQDLALPRDERRWADMEREFVNRLRPTVGRAAVAAQAAPATKVTVFRLPRSEPDWINERVEIQGTAADVGGKLRTRARAEVDARAKLRERMESLPLEKNWTVGQAAREHPPVADAIERTLDRARTYKTEYRGDGSVTVYMVADLRDVWNELIRR